MKILWLCNKTFSDADTGGGGTWLQPLANALVQSGTVELANINQGPVKAVTYSEHQGVKQWVVPATRVKSNGLPAPSVIRAIVKAAQEFSPDIIHIWGTENYWGLLTARNILPYPALLRIQGIKYIVGRQYTGNLTFAEKIQCIGIKELIRCRTVFQVKRKFEHWKTQEKEIIAGHQHIITQSPWTEAQVRAVNPTCKLYHNPPAVRSVFSKTEPWRKKQVVNTERKIKLFCTAAYSSPFKGLHVAARAVKILSSKFDNIELRIAGNHQCTGIRRDGYIAWLRREIRKQGIEEKISWLGPLKEEEIIRELQECSVFIMPSFIESYSVALIEALTIGVPSVVSYVGGLPQMATDKESALFFSPGDHAMCAYQVEKILTDGVLAEKLSEEGRKILPCNKTEVVSEQLLDIYTRFPASTTSRTT